MENVYIIAGTTLGVIGLITLFGYLAYKKVDVPAWIAKIKSFLEGAEDFTNIVEQHSTGKVEKAAKFSDYLLEQAVNFVGGTEQMYLSSQVSASDRKQTAINAITDLLKTQNIKITDEMQNVISMYVEKACGDESIKNINEKIDKLVSSIKSEKEALQTQLNTTINENTTLRTTITTLQNKLAVAQNALSNPNASFDNKKDQ